MNINTDAISFNADRIRFYGLWHFLVYLFHFIELDNWIEKD